MSDSAGSVSIEIRADLSKLKEDLNKIKSELNAMEDKGDIKVGNTAKAVAAGNLLESGLNRISETVRRLGRDFTRITAAYEVQMNKVKAVTGASEEEIENLSQLIKQLGQESMFTSTQVAEGAVAFAKQGGTIKGMLGGALRAAVDLAVATDSTLTPAVDAVQDAMRAFNVEASKSTKVVDVVSSSVNNSKFTLVKYKQAMAQAATIAGNYGVDLDEFAQVIGATSKAFNSGSDAGTSFKNFLSFLIPKSEAAKDTIEQLGLQFFDLEGKVKPIGEIADELKTKLEGLSDEKRLSSLKNIFGVDAIRTAIELSKLGADGLQKFGDKMAEVDAKTISDIRMQGLAGATERFAGSMENLSIAIGESGLVEMLTDVFNTLAKVADWFAALPKPVLKFTVIAVGLAAVLVPLGVALGILVASLAAIGAPSLATVAAITAVAAAVVALGVVTRDIAQGLADKFVEALTVTWEACKQLGDALINGLANAFQWTWDKIKAFGEWLANGFVELVSGTWEYLTTSEGLVRALGGTWEWLAVSVPNWLSEMMSKIWEYLVTKMQNVADKISNITGAIGQYFYDMYDKVVGHSYVPDMVDRIIEEFNRLDTGMVDKAKGQTEHISEYYRTMAKNVENSMAAVSNASNTGGGVSGSSGESGGGKGKSKGLDFEAGLSSLLGNITGLLGNKIEKKLPGAGGLFTNVFGSLGNFDVPTTVNGMGSLFGGGGVSSVSPPQSSGQGGQVINFNMGQLMNPKSFEHSMPQMASLASSSLNRSRRITA